MRPVMVCVRLFLLAVILVVFFCIIVKLGSAAECPANLWKGIIAENTNPQDYQEYLAIAQCYRNRLERGLRLGCVGIKRSDLDQFVSDNVRYVMARYKKPIDVWAQQAVQEAFDHTANDLINGADHYENIEAFGVPSWAKNKQVVAKVGKHTFYR